MIELPNVTLVSIDTTDDLSGTLNAVYTSINAGMKSFRQQMKEKMDPELLGEITNKFAGIAEVIVGIVEDELK
jgi:hypothetical protein